MKKIIIYLLLCITCSSCEKYLDEKPDKKLVVPATVSDLQALLNNNPVMNGNFPSALEVAADNYYVTTADWQARTTTEQNSYLWQAEVFNDVERNDWSLPYVTVYNANIILEAAKELTEGDAITINNIKGAALFYRSFEFFHLLQLFAQPYGADAATQLGIPLRLSSDLNIPVQRASLKESYDQIIADIQTAIPLLPNLPVFKTQPSKSAAYALLARTYTSMSLYDSAYKYADAVLQINNTLIDYNTLSTTAANPVARFNTEDLFFAFFSKSILLASRCKVDSNLYKSYADNDLRKSIFFTKNTDGSYAFKGGYTNNSGFYAGLATDEMYLIKAECLARKGNITEAMNVLNTLMQQRWKKGTFVPFTASTINDALSKILTERRKELIFRAIRWSDLRRLNKESQWAVTLTRIINNVPYTLAPNSNAYVFPIPSSVINNTGIQQNPR